MPLPIPEFMVKFQQLKQAVNSKPETIIWKSKQQKIVADLVYDIWEIDTRIIRQFSIQREKFTAHVDSVFVSTYREYDDRYKDEVFKAAPPIVKAKTNEMLQRLSNIDEEKLQNFLEVSGFDPAAPKKLDLTKDDPADCFDSMLDYVPDWLDVYEGETADFISKGLGAWEYLRDTIGIDLHEIQDRWTSIPHTFIPRHVSTHHGLEIGSLYRLLAEAHRAYVFGCNGAAMALCRSILEDVFTRHYGIKGEDLKDIITKAEVAYRHITSGMNLHGHRKTVNLVLHDPQRLKELTSEQVSDFLRILKELIERAPKKTNSD